MRRKRWVVYGVVFGFGGTKPERLDIISPTLNVPHRIRQQYHGEQYHGETDFRFANWKLTRVILSVSLLNY
jgi:hypothetical protein